MDAPSGPSGSVASAPAAAAAAAGAASAAGPTRTKSKAYQTTIAAEADDLKYESKYKELKKKVREVEEDNDSLYVKILQAQQSIQRLRLERSIIYERLASNPPPPTSSSGGGPASGQETSNLSSSANPPQGPNASSSSSSTNPVAGAGAGGPHAPHPLSQSFTPTTHPNGQTVTASRQAAPPQTSSKRGSLSSVLGGAEEMDVDVSSSGHPKPAGFHPQPLPSKGSNKGSSSSTGAANGVTLPPISPGGMTRPKAEVW